MGSGLDTEEQEFQGIDLVLGIAKRRWPVAAITFLAFFLPAFTVVWNLPELYRSNATVLIEHQQIPGDLVRSTVTSALETRLQTISQEILSRQRLEELINGFGLYPEMRQSQPIEAVLQRMRGDISLQLQSSGQRGNTTTVAFTIGYKGNNPDKVSAVTNQLASFYIEENLKARGDQARSTSDFFEIQLAEAKRALETMEQRVSAFKREHIGELPHQQEGNLGSLEQLNTRLRLNSDKQTRVSETIASLEERLSQVAAPAGGPDATAARIAELRQSLRDLRKQYSEKYPDVIRVKAEIAALVEAMAERSRSESELALPDTPEVAALKDELANAEIEMVALQGEAQQLGSAIAQYERRLDNAPLAEQQYQILMRDYDTTAELYRSLLLRQTEAQLAENMETRQKGEQFRLIDPAFPSQLPAAPNRPMLWAVAALLALGAAGGLVMLLEQIDTSYHSLSDLRAKAAAPILASIPRIVTTRDVKRKRWRAALATLGSVAGIALLVGVSYWIAAGNERLAGLLMR